MEPNKPANGSKPAFAHTITATKGPKGKVFAITRGGRTVMEYSAAENPDKFFRRVTEYLNRDRRGLMDLEDMIIRQRNAIGTLNTMMDVLTRRLAQIAPPNRREIVAKWTSTAADVRLQLAKELNDADGCNSEQSGAGEGDGAGDGLREQIESGE